MDGHCSAQESARSAIEKPDNEDDEAEDADAAKDGQTRKITEVLVTILLARGEGRPRQWWLV